MNEEIHRMEFSKMSIEELKSFVHDLNSQLSREKLRIAEAKLNGIQFEEKEILAHDVWKLKVNRLKGFAEKQLRGRNQGRPIAGGGPMGVHVVNLAALLLADRVLDGEPIKEAAKDCMALAKECYNAVWELSKEEGQR